MKTALAITAQLMACSALKHKASTEQAGTALSLDEVLMQQEQKLDNTIEKLQHQDELKMEANEIFWFADDDMDDQLSYQEFGKVLDQQADFHGEPRMDPTTKQAVAKYVDRNLNGKIDKKEALNSYRVDLTHRVVDLSRQVEYMKYELGINMVEYNIENDDDLEENLNQWWSIEQKQLEVQEAIQNPKWVADHIRDMAGEVDWDQDGELDVYEFGELINAVEHYLRGPNAEWISWDDVETDILPEADLNGDGKIQEDELVNQVRSYVYPSLVELLAKSEAKLVELEEEEYAYWDEQYPMNQWMEGYDAGYDDCEYDNDIDSDDDDSDDSEDTPTTATP